MTYSVFPGSAPDPGPAGCPVQFPPRDRLPPWAEVIKVPGLGRSWYERGFRYWCVRVLQVLAHLVALGVAAAVLGGFVKGLGLPGGLIALAAEAVFAVPAAVFVFTRSRRPSPEAMAKITARLANPAGARRNGWITGACAAGTYILIRVGGPAGAVVMCGLCFFLPGPVLGLLGVCLTTRVLPVEQAARCLLAERLAAPATYQAVPPPPPYPAPPYTGPPAQPW